MLKNATDNNVTSEESEVKAKFVPKRRTPYLMQNEFIKQKENDELLKKEETSKLYDLVDVQKAIEVKESSQLVVKKETISSQNKIEPHKNEMNFYDEVTKLYGLQKKIAHFFVKRCIERNQDQTGPITAEMLCNVTGSTQKTLKKIIQRMIEKNLLVRLSGKQGKGGFSLFKLDPDFINIMKLHSEVELDFMAVNSLSKNMSVKNNVSFLPDDWNNIDLTQLIAAFQESSAKTTQFFGKAQLKIIYNAAGNKLSSEDVQNSIKAFAYGLKNFSKEAPYVKMNNPAAVLLGLLKNGEVWEEKKYLSAEENELYEQYMTLSGEIQQNMQDYFEKWKETDRNKKYEYYKNKIRSNEFYNERVFHDKAWEDYSKNLWAKEKLAIIADLIGVNQDILNKFDHIAKA